MPRSATLACLGQAPRRGRRGLGRGGRREGLLRGPPTQRRLFDSLVEQLNPFYEDPAAATQKRYSAELSAINALEEGLKGKSDEELREVTTALKERVSKGEDLKSVLPEAFAIVREASSRVLGLRHFDVQMLGGIALHEGQIAEMGTGEGKTLVAILPAFLNALKGKGTHIVTVNDYLARRDAEWVGQPLRFLGMSVGIVQSEMTPDQKRKAYRCDVTYVTNSELGFDYLRDQMAPAPSELVLRESDPFQFCVVDEVDSILIDEARTPLIISGVANNPSQKYQVAKEVATTLRKTVHYNVDEKQRQAILVEEGVEAAEKLLGKDDLFDPQDPWFPFISNALNAKELYIKDKQYIVKKGEIMIVDEFTGRVMEGRRWSNGLHQAVEAKERVEIQAESVTLASISYQSLFRLFNKLSGMTGTAFTEAKEFEEIYKLKCVVIPPNRTRAREDKDDQVFTDDIGKWKAVAREIDNAHRIGRPVLIGTTNVENSEIIAELLDALGVPYQLLNAKPENVTRETEIVANSGRKYQVTIATNMAGRGTDILLGGNPTIMARLKLREELYNKIFPAKTKLWTMPDDFYPIDLTDDLLKEVNEVVKLTVEAWTTSTSEKPTTLGAAERIVEGELTELEAEERLSLACEKAPTQDEVLLRLREVYKKVCAQFGEITDLEKKEVIALGGLYVLGTERHESRRIDNQLRGRCARQGDPGSTRFFLSLNDTIFRIFGGDGIKNMMGMMTFTEQEDAPLESGLLSSSLEEAQKKVENYFYSVRKSVFDYDDVMDTQRKIVYGLRRRALLDSDDSIRETMREFSAQNLEDFVEGHIDKSKPPTDWNLDVLSDNVKTYCSLLKETVTPEELKEAAGSGGEDGAQKVTEFLTEKGILAFDQKCKEIEDTGPGLTGLVQRQILLMQVDSFWQQHLKNMDFMKTGVSLRSYGQKNPLTEYKLEGYQVFLKMMSRIRRNAVYNTFLFTPRKLKPMDKDRVQSLIPNRDVRRKQMKELMGSEAFAAKEGTAKDPASKAAASANRAVNLARLALDVRALLEAREQLKELALAGFVELKEAFGRAGLYTQGDQLRWASACPEFELLEDDLQEEGGVPQIYIGLKGRTVPVPNTDTDGEARATFAADQAEQAAAAERYQRDSQVLSDVMDNPEFMQQIGQFASSPELFLEKMKESASEQSWTAEDVSKMREMYRAAGVDIDAMLAEMESTPELPEAQREVVAFMKKLLNEGESGGDGAQLAEQQEASSKVKV